MPEKILAINIDKLRRASGWSVEELAKAVGVSRSTVNRWLAGTSMPQPENISSLAAAFSERQGQEITISDLQDEPFDTAKLRSKPP